MRIERGLSAALKLIALHPNGGTAIEYLSKNATVSAEELTEIIKANFGDAYGGKLRTSIEITKDTKIEDFPEHLQGQIGLIIWAYY